MYLVRLGSLLSIFLCAVTASAQPVPETPPETPPDQVGDQAVVHQTVVTQADPRVDQLQQDAATSSAQLEQALARIQSLEEQAAAEPEEEDASEESGVVIRPLISTFTRLELRNGYNELGTGAPACNGTDGDCIRWRARLGLDVIVPLSDTVSARARFLPQFAGFWAATPGTSGTLADPAIGVHEASLLLQVGEEFGIEMGRFEMIYGEHTVIGNVGWHPNGRAFDGARLLLRPGKVKIDAFFTLLNEGNLTTLGRGDRYFYGVYAGLGGLFAEGMALDVYVLGLQTNATVNPTGTRQNWSQRTHIGARFKNRFGSIDVLAEGGMQIGRAGNERPMGSNLILAGHALAEVGIHLMDDKLRVALHGAYASGDDPTTDRVEGYNQLFPTAHKFLGFTDVMGGRTNIMTGILRLQLKPMANVMLAFDAHIFARPEQAGDSYTGAETDLHLVWKPLPGFRTRAMYGLFIPNEDVWGNDELVHYVEFEVGFDLK